MEATAQATQRKITVCSFELVHARRPDIQAFNELLVMYPVGERRKNWKVVPDNMVVVHDEPIEARGHFSLRLQPAAPFWVLEYVSKESERKDYEQNMRKYERQLKVPYYLIFYPDNQELTLFRHNGRRYASVVPDGDGLHALPELEMAVGMVEGWARFWFRGEMLPLPGDLQHDLDETRRQLGRSRRETRRANRRADEESERADVAIEREALASERAAEASERAALASERAAEAERWLSEEQQSRLRMEAELARMRADLEAIRRSGEAG
jgi:Uma2 family endonuclease